MKRREFISLLGGAGPILLFAARAQQSGPIRRIGVLLISGAETDPDMQARGSAFRQELEKLGWSEGRNVRFDTRYAAAILLGTCHW